MISRIKPADPTACKILPLRGMQLISLWDMIHFLADEFIAIFRTVRTEADRAYGASVEFITVEMRKGLLDLLDRAEKQTDVVGFTEIKGRIKPFRARLEKADEECSYEVVCCELDGLEQCLSEELKKRYFLFMPLEQVELWEQEKLFGETVYERFEDAREDIKQAGNCRATDLHTASIFHLMRVAEVGLRTVAKKLNVTLAYPIDFATWGTVLDQIDVELKALRGKTLAKERKRQFYSGVASEIRAFQYLWRDPMVHSRKDASHYDQEQAKSAYNHVQAFMQKLSTRK